MNMAMSVDDTLAGVIYNWQKCSDRSARAASLYHQSSPETETLKISLMME